MSEFEHALGVYVGTATFADIAKTLGGHTPGQWVIRLTDAAGETLWYRDGWSWIAVEDEDYFVFTIARTEQGAGNPALFVDAPVVLTFAKDLPVQASVYTGGLVVELAFGDYAGHTLTMVVWHSILHVTESGDIAPGFGGFAVGDVEQDDDG